MVLKEVVASIRDIADVSDGSYNYKDAVSSLENMEFSANVGKLSARKITEGHCPLIVDLKNGKTAVLTKVIQKKNIYFMMKIKTKNILPTPTMNLRKILQVEF